MKFYLFIFFNLFGIIACQYQPPQKASTSEKALCEPYLYISDSLHTQKEGRRSFEQNRVYIDAAMNIASEEMHIEKRNQHIIVGVLALGFIVISFLAYRLYRISESYKKLYSEKESKIVEIQLINKEIQHRIKNNLHLIFSLLNMQERKTENTDTIESLQKARLRIESIAALHDLLGQTNANSIDFDIYIHKLIDTIINCIETEHKVITNIAIQQIALPQQYFFPLGLLLNEWIINSIKYAQPESSLILTLNVKHEEGIFILEYYDNGRTALQQHIKIGLGKEITALLTQQIKGKLILNAENPYHYCLKIENM